MPPGPSGLPVLGNLSQMMKARRDPISFNKWVSFKPVEQMNVPWAKHPTAGLLDTVW